MSGVNPVDDPEAALLVPVDGGQHSLWPAFDDVPDGTSGLAACSGSGGANPCLPRRPSHAKV
ncbi:MbtH family protein [Streptomyces sp. GMY02]|nr:MbtH family protein [Streptomyces sp. GMY02]